MEIMQINNKSPIQVVRSLCSCPSCDSLECFSKRYSNGLEICSCSKCTLRNCLYMSREEPTIQSSNHEDRCVKDFNINDDDVARIDVVVIKETGYGEIKEKTFKDHTERIIIKKASTCTQTNTKFKKSPSSKSTSINQSSTKSKEVLEQCKKTKINSSNTKVHDEITKARTKTTFKEDTTSILKNNKPINDSSFGVTCEELQEHHRDTSEIISKSKKAKEEVKHTKNPSSSTTRTNALQEEKRKGSNRKYLSDGEQKKDIRAFPSKQNKAVLKEKIDATDDSLLMTCESIGGNKKSTNELLVEERKNTEEFLFDTCPHRGSLEQNKNTIEFPTESCKVVQEGDKNANALPSCATSESVLHHKKYSKNSTEQEQIKNTEEPLTCVNILAQIIDSQDFPTKSCKNIRGEEKSGKSSSVEDTDISLRQSCGSFLQEIRTREPCITCGIYLEEIKDTKGFSTKSNKLVRGENKYDKDVSPCATSASVDERDEKKYTIDFSVEDEMKNIKEIPSCGICEGLVQQIRDNMEFRSKICKKVDGENENTMINPPCSTTSSRILNQKNIRTHNEQRQPNNTKNAPLYIARNIIHEQDTNISRSRAKVDGLPEATNSNNLQKNLTKQEIYDRILEAYKNCTCRVCECIVTQNDVSTLETNDSCACKPCECLKDIAFAKKCHTDCIEDLCTCKPYVCLLCTRQTQKECNCNPCECLECSAISYNKDATDPEQKDCDCSSCQSEDCKRNTGHDYVGNHEMSTGPDNMKQQCTCELCSYHFCGHQVENESCECETQNKLMRKPNASCRCDFDVRTVSLHMTNNKPKFLHSTNNNLSAHDYGSSQIVKKKIGKRVCKLNFKTERGSEVSDYQSDSDSSEKVSSQVSPTMDSSREFENISDKFEDIFLGDRPQLYLDSKKNLIYTNERQCKTQFSESIGIQNDSGICEDKCNSPFPASKEKFANPLSIKPLKKYAPNCLQNNFQIYNIKHNTLKNNSSKLTTSSRNISTGSSKLVQSIIYEICHEILECIIVEATEDVVIKIEMGGKNRKSVTVLKDAKTKSDEVDFSESSLRLEPTENKSANSSTKRKGNITVTHKKPNDFPRDNKDALPESNSEIGIFNAKNLSKGGYQDCNFCVIDKSFGQMLNYDKYNNQGQNYKETQPEFMRHTTVSRATKISRPDHPLKYNWVNTNSLVHNGSRVSIHDSNNFEYYNNIFELQVYNIRLENTLKKAKNFSMELMKILQKFENANKHFKTLSKKFHPIPAELKEDSDEEEHTNETLPSPKRCPSPLRKIKTCLQSRNTNKASKLERKNALTTQNKVALNLGQSTRDSYSECILYDESLDNTLSPYKIRRRNSKPMNSTTTGPDSERRSFSEVFKDGIEFRTNGASGFREFNGQDDINEHRFYNALNPQQQLLCTNSRSNMRKIFYPNNARTTQSIETPLRPISTLNPTHDDTKSPAVRTGIWDGNTYKKKTYENRALAKLKMEVTQLSNMPFLQPRVWSTSYDGGTSDSKSEDDFLNVPMNQRRTYKENMWDTLLKDIDYSYTLPPKHKNDENRQFEVNLNMTKTEYRSPPKLEDHAFMHPRQNMKTQVPNLSLKQFSNVPEASSYKEGRISSFSIVSNKPGDPVQHLTQSKKLKVSDVPYSPKDHISEHDQQVDKGEFLDSLNNKSPREDDKDMELYKDFLKNLEKGSKHPPHEKKVLDCRNSSCDALKVGMVAVRRVSNHTAIVKWTAPRIDKNILGYEILIDGRGVQKILNPTCRMCVVTCLPYTATVLVTIRTLTSGVADHAPATTVVYRPRVK